MFAQIFDKLISDSESVRTMFDQLFEFSIRHVKVMNAVTGRDDSSDISIEQLRSEKPTEPISYCPDFSIYTWDVEKVLKHIHAVFTEHKYPIYTFPIYLETHVEEIIKVGISDKPSNICLAALKYISANPYHVALRTLNVDSEVFRESIDKYEHLEEILDVMVSFNTKLMGTSETFKDKFIHSLQQIIKLQNTWEYIKICNINNKLEGDKSISEDRLFDIYGGDYSQIPKTTRIIETDIDMTTVTQTDDKLVNSFIYQNFNRFCDLLESYGKTVYKVLNNSNEKDFTKEITSYNSKLDYYNLNSKSLKTMFTHISSIKDKHIVYGLKDVIDVIIYNYVPELRKLKFNKYFDESLAISMITSGSNSMLLGVALYIPSVKIREQTKETLVKNKVIMGGNTETDGVNSELLSATNKFDEYSLTFINSFISNYKRIIDKLSEINWNSLKVKADTKYKNSFVLLRKLLIKKPETLSKLIDIDENDNFNYDYIKACNEFVAFIRNNQLNIYNNIINEVEAISELLGDIHKKAINFRNDTFNIKKNKIDFDYLAMYAIKLQRELNLKIKVEFDKEKVDEKIDKIIKYTLSSISSLEYPYDTSKNKEKLEEYLSKIKDRESTIKEYFETLRHDCKYSYQQLSPRVKNLVITFSNIYNSLVNEYEKSYLWLNNEFDKFITKDRIKQMDKITLTNEQIKSIISAAEQIDKYKPINNIAEQFDEYVSSIMSANVTDFYKCYQFIRNAYEEVGVLNYIEIIYKTLDIVDTSSKEWYTFKSNLLNFLTINSIWFDIYRLDNDRYVLADKKLRVGAFDSGDYKFTELTRFPNNFEFFNIVNNIFSNKFYDNTHSVISYNHDEYNIPFSSENMQHIKPIIKEHMNEAQCCDVIRFLFEVMENLSINGKDSKFKFGYAINDKSIFKPFNKELDTRIFKALYVPIFQKINKYIILNKSDDNTVFDDKIMLTMLGGAKQYGSSLYDYSEPHKVEEIKFIEDYLPVYVSCYSIINYYVSYLNDLMKNSKLLSIDTLFKCSMLNSIIDKTEEGFKIKEINVINVDKYLKFINDICSKNKKKDADLTKFAIESISSEFNSMLTLSKSLKSNELKNVDLYSEFDNLTDITEDIRNVIEKMRELYINNGFNYSVEYKNVMERLKEEMKVTSDKKAFFINCIEKLDGKHTNDTFNTKKVFIDLYYAPIEIVTKFWVEKIGSISKIDNVNDVQQILYRLYLLYGNKYHSLKELYTCVFDEFYKDLDECIHHVINYKNFNDKAVEQTQKVHNEIKKIAMELKADIDSKFAKSDYKIDDKMIPCVPFIGNPIVKVKLLSNPAGAPVMINTGNNPFSGPGTGPKHYQSSPNLGTAFNINANPNPFNANSLSSSSISSPSVSSISSPSVSSISSPSVSQKQSIHQSTKQPEDDSDDSSDTVELNLGGGNISYAWVIDKNIGAINHYISFKNELCINKITITDMIINFIASITQENTIPLRMVELLKNSELNNNTFKIFPMSDRSLFWSKDINANKGNIFQDDIIGAFSSIIIHKSLYNNDLGTDVNSQVYCNKLLSIINFSIHTLETMLNSLIPGREYYNSYIHNIDEHQHFTVGTSEFDLYGQITNDWNGIIVPKINAKKEINILINILKELYSYYAPRAKECEFLGGNVLTPDHYIIELTKIFGYDSNEFKLHFMNNVEKYQWVIPTIKKIDYDIKYNDPFEKYFKNINNMDKLIEKKDHMHIMKILAKLILYRFLSINNILRLQPEVQINTALSGGADIEFTDELGNNYKFDDSNFTHDVNYNKSIISVSKDIFNPLQYVLNDKEVMNKLNINSNKDEFLYGDNEYITSQVSQIIKSDDLTNVRRVNVKCKNSVVNYVFINEALKTVKFNNGSKRTYYYNRGEYYEVLADYDINSEKIEESEINENKIYGEYNYNYKNFKDLYEHIKSNCGSYNKDYKTFINQLSLNKNAVVNGHKFGLNKISTDDNKYKFLVNIFNGNAALFNDTMLYELSKDKLILDTINKRKLWLIAISVLMLYSYYGLWNESLLDRLLILSKKIINLYNDKYTNSKPYIFINELIKNKTISFTYNNTNIEVSTYDLIELNTYYIPEISSLTYNKIENPILDNHIEQVNNDIYNIFNSLLTIINDDSVKLNNIILIEDNKCIKIESIASGDFIEQSKDDEFIVKDYENLKIIGLNNAIFYGTTYKYIITTLINLISTSSSENNLYDKYVSIKSLYRMFILLYCSVINQENNLDNKFYTNIRNTFILFNNIILKYKRLLSYRTDNIKEEIKKAYDVRYSLMLIKNIYKNFKLNNNIIEFNTKILNPNNNHIININADNINEITRGDKFFMSGYINGNAADNLQTMIKINLMGLYYNSIKNKYILKEQNKIRNILHALDVNLMNHNLGHNKDIGDESYNNFNTLIYCLLVDTNYNNIFNSLLQVVNATNQNFRGVNWNNIAFQSISDSEEKNNIDELFASMNYCVAAIGDGGVSDAEALKYFKLLKSTCILLIESIDKALKYTLNYLMHNVVEVVKRSRGLYNIFSSIGKHAIFPYENIINTNYNIALDDIYKYFDLFNINNIDKSINNINKEVFTLIKDSQIEMAKKKMTILLSPKQINSLKNINNKNVKHRIDNMYANRNISLININKDVRDILNDRITDPNGRNKNYKEYYLNKWYLRGLSNNNIVVKTMIEILLESMDLNIYHTTYQLHPFNNNIPLIPLNTRPLLDRIDQDKRFSLIYALGDVYCNNNIYYIKNKPLDYNTILQNINPQVESCKTLLLSMYLLLTFTNTNNPQRIKLINNKMLIGDYEKSFIDRLMTNEYILTEECTNDINGEVVPKFIYDNDKLNQISNILLNGNMSGGDLVLEDPNTILEKFVNEKHTIFDKYIFRYHSNIKSIILGHFANIIASYSNYLSGLTYYQILYSSEVFDSFVKNIRETFKNNNIRVQNSEISCIYHVINSLLSDELTERVKLPMISSVNTIGNELNNSNFIQDNVIYPFINKRKFFDMKSKEETLLSKLTEYDSKCLIDKIVDIEFYNMAVNCILIYIIKYIYNNRLSDDTINYIDNEVSL